MADFKNKKGATGKKYTVTGDVIKVTYTDGSTRIVRPTDASYKATKKAMETDIANRNFLGIGNKKSNVTAEDAIGKGVTEGIGVVTTAKKNQQNQQYSDTMKQRRQEQTLQSALKTAASPLEQAKTLNQAIDTINTQKAVDTLKGVTADSVKSGVEHGIQNTIAGTNQGLASTLSNLGRGGLTEGAPYMSVAEKLGVVNPGTQTNLMQQQKSGMEQLQRALATNAQAKSQQISQKYGNLSTGEQFVSDMVANIIPMGGAIAGGAIAGPAGAMLPMYNYAKGLSVSQALNDGAGYDQAQAYGIGKGALETGTELLTRGVAGLPGAVKLGQKVAGKIADPTLKKVGSALADVAGEGAEEALAEIVDPFLQRATYNQDAEIDWNNVSRAALLGAATAGAINMTAAGASKAVNMASKAKNQPKNMQNQGVPVQNAQNSAGKVQDNSASKYLPRPEKQAQNQNIKADFQQNTGQNIQNQETVKNTPKITLEMADRTFENVGNQKVKAYQQENPEIKPFQQATAEELLFDLQMGVKGGRDAGVDPETRTVTKMGGWQRQQSEPIERMLRDGMSYNQIEDGLQRIVEDHGKENTANAKRAELYVHDAMQNGYNSIVNGRMDANRNYAISKMSMEELEAEAQRLTESLSTTTDEYQLEMITNQLDAIESRMNLLKHDIRPTLNRPVQNPEPTIAENATVAYEYEDYDAKQLPKDVFDFYNQVGEVGGKAHFNIRVVQNLEHDAEGKSDGNGNILISAERANDIETVRRVVAHEVYHAMKETEQWGDIQDLAYELYKLDNPNGTQEDMLQAKIDQYYERSGGKVQLDTDGAWDEIGAEMMGEILSDPKMAERIWNQNPTLAERIKRWLEDMVAKLYDYVTISEENSIYKRALEAYSEGLRNMEYRGQSSETSEGQYSIQDIEGKKKKSFVRADENRNLDSVFVGDNPNVWAKNVENYINKEIRHGEDLRLMADNGDVLTITGRTAWKAKDRGELNNKEFRAKLEMECHIDELAVVSTPFKSEDDFESKHAPRNMAERGWQYREAFYEASDGTYYRVVISVALNGEVESFNTDEVYNVGKFRQRKNTVSNSGSSTREGGAQAAETSNYDISAYTDSISENSDNDNRFSDTPMKEQLAKLFKNDGNKPMYSLPKKLPNSKYIDQSDENLRNFMEGSAVVNEDGSPKVVYSGHGNTNLFGTSFDKKKATAGGFYFTANPEIASNYAKDKLGVKEYYENGDEYRIKNEKGQYKLKLRDIRLTDEQVEKFDEWFDEDLGWTYEDFVKERGSYDSRYRNLRYSGGKHSLSNVYWLMNELGYTETYTYHRKNGEEYRASAFEILMDEMGIEWDSYNQKSGGVFPIYLSIKNPIDTSQPFPQDVMKRLERIASRERRMSWEELDDAHWTANYPVYKWIEDIKRMEETGEETYWATQVPTKARKILQEMGYDGIKDTGGKMGGEEHEVWIAFEPTQVKSAIGNRGTYDATKKDMRYSFDAVGSQEYKDLLDEHGSIPEGENPTGENYRVEVPRKGMDGKKVREFVRTIMEAPSVDDAVANMFAQELIDPEQVLSGILTMESTSNKALVDAANESIATKGWQQNYKDLHSRMTTGDKITAQDIALATRVAQEAQKAGDAHATFDILTDLTVVASEFGQGLQAVKILKRLSPEGQLMAFMKTQKRINDSLEKQGKKRVKTMSKETAEEFLKARGNKKRDEIMAREMARMGQETEGTWTDKLNALRYAAMLSNPRTHIRNIIGNVMMAVVHQPTVAISAAIEDATRLGQKALRPNGVPAEQYRSLVNRSGNSYMELRDYANQVFKEIEPALRAGGSRYSDAHGGFRQNQRVFGHSLPGRVLEQFAGNGKLSVSSVLEGEDMLAKRLAFNSALAGYMKANGISVKEAMNDVVKPNGASIERGKEYAKKQAEKATFTEENRAADALSRLENTNMASKVLMGGLMPFKNTPMNILTRGFEYSPAGVAMTFYKLKHAATNSADKYERAYNMNDVFESLAANMTGTALMYLGYKMAEAGLLAGAGDDDNERKSRYDQLMGSQEYAFTVPDTGESWTIDWLAPVAMPLFAGAEVFNQVLMRNENAGDPDYDNMIVSALGRIIEPVFEMSCMQGVSDALASYSSGGTEFASSVGKTLVTGYAGQFVPQPLAAAARTMDDTVRSTYTSKESDFPIVGKPGEQFLRQQKNKIPGKSQENEPSIDVWGNERKREFAGDSEEQFAKRALNNFFNPTTYSSDKRTELDKELEKLYSNTGESTVLPKAADSSFEYQGKTYYMTPQEKTAYDRTKGQKSRQYVSGFVNSGAYDSMDDNTKADIIADLYNLANYEAKKQMLMDRDITDFENSTYEKVLQSGVNPGEYYSTRKALDNKYSYEDAVDILENLESLNMTPEKYLEVMQATSDINSYDANGKSKKGLKKQRIQVKAKELGLTAQQASFIYEMSGDNWRMYNIWN